MSLAKDLYLRDKDEANKGLVIVKDDSLARLIIFSKSEYAQQNPTKEQMEGVNRFVNILLNLPETEEKSVEMPNSGLNHESSAPLKHALTTDKQATD